MIGKLAVVLVVATFGIARADMRTKDWEIYSWFDSACSESPSMRSEPNADSVCFALLPVPHHDFDQRPVAEIKKARMKLSELKKALTNSELAKGDDVTWTVGDETTAKYFDLPSEKPSANSRDPRDQAVRELRRVGLKLTIYRPKKK